MNIIFDMDGTLVDNGLRLYSLFNDLAPLSRLSFEQYRRLKQNNMSNEMILASKLGLETNEINRFLKKWMQLIESPPYLKLDTFFEGIHDTLSRLSAQAKLHVCTNRQYPQRVVNQLKNLDLWPIFNKILVTEQQISKEKLIHNNISDLSNQDWIIGDTGKDIKAGKMLNIKTCGVLSGFFNQELLLGYRPDSIIESAVNFNIV